MNPSMPIPVAVFLTRFAPGGTERQMIELIRRLDRKLFRVHVVCTHREGAWEARATERAASVVSFPMFGFARPATLRQITAFARWCRHEHIAVVHTGDFYTNVFGLPAAMTAGVPVRIGNRREINPDKTAAQMWLQRQAYRTATTVVANSSAARAALEAEGLPSTAIAIIPNGLDAASYPVGVATTARAPRTVITVANLRVEKGHDTLIAAAALIAPEFPGVTFQFVGDGPERARLEARVAALGLGDRIGFFGHRDDVPALLAEADVFALPSRSEAFPNSVMEAMAAGLPVVASAVGGIPELVEQGRTGLLVEPGDPVSLGRAIRDLLVDRHRAARLGRAARAHVIDRYSFDRMTRAFEDLYLSRLPAAWAPDEGRVQAAGI